MSRARTHIVTSSVALSLALSALVSSWLLLSAFTLTKPETVGHKPKTETFAVPRAKFAGLHIGMSQDSAFAIFRAIALRRDTLHVDSLLLLESDSVRVFGQPAYIQAQILHHRVRTIVVNFHPFSGGKYVNVRDVIDQYMIHLFGRGVEENEESLTHHRWETEEGTMEVSHSDKYERIFVRLGQPRV